MIESDRFPIAIFGSAIGRAREIMYRLLRDRLTTNALSMHTFFVATIVSMIYRFRQSIHRKEFIFVTHPLAVEKGKYGRANVNMHTIAVSISGLVAIVLHRHRN